MTPTAVTPAARRPRPPRAAPAAATVAPRAPRRVSGPIARPDGPAAPRPRRAGPARQGPARPSTPSAPAAPAAPRTRTRTRTQSAARAPWTARAVAGLRTLPDHSLLDRVVRGRLWIPLLGVLLAGIVAMQVEVLKLNASIGHAMVATGQLQTRNQQLRAAVSSRSDDQRVEAAAARQPMQMPAPSTPQFVAEHGAADVRAALAGIRPPDPSGFALRTREAAAARQAQVIPSTGQ
jgi:hypothetical protein